MAGAAKCQPSHYVNFEKCTETVVHEEPDFTIIGFISVETQTGAQGMQMFQCMDGIYFFLSLYELTMEWRLPKSSQRQYNTSCFILTYQSNN